MADARQGDVEKLWIDYQSTSSADSRDALIVNYSPLVKYVANRVGAGLPSSVDHADLVSYGMFGLIDAIERFDLERGYKFETFSLPRIKGAILDELRSMDWVPRSVRTKARDIERAITQLESELGRSPSDEEVAEKLEVSVDLLHKRLTDISSGGITALDEVRSTSEGETATLRDLLADSAGGPGSRMEEQETRAQLLSFVNALSDREKAVLTLYYFENLTMAQIGEILGVTESRVCQIHTKAVLQLRSKFNAADR